MASITPDRETFHRLASRGTVVPVWHERLADLDTPVSAFARVVGDAPGFLLESVQGGERWAAYSFVGCDPLASIVGRAGRIEVTLDGQTEVHDDAEPLAAVERTLGRLTLAAADEADRPRLMAGAVGYLAYDWVRSLESLPEQAEERDGLPEVNLIVPATVLVFDNLRQVIRIVRNVHLPAGTDLDAAYDAGCAELEQVSERLDGPLPARASLAAPPDPRPLGGFTSDFSRADFEAAVERVREYVLAGDCIQAVLSQRFTRALDVDPFDVYRALRTTNPSPYMYFLRLGDGGDGKVEIAGASPEVLTRVIGDEVIVRPIAGTRPRGQTPEEDRLLEAELRADPKERAEHVMLVDLGRNDVGRVAEPGRVEVRELMVVERYSHVMHLVSEVRGRLPPGRSSFDVLRATFPAGTLSGAPKVRAMEIIEELEPVRRGIYGGAVGYFGLDGAMDFCIGIRTLVAHGERMWVQAGAGIVADSVAAREYEETVDKARCVFRAVELARGGLVL